MHRTHLEISVDELAQKVGEEDLHEILKGGRTSELKILLGKTEKQIEAKKAQNNDRKQLSSIAGRLLAVKKILLKLTGDRVI